jgi:hypothetical protein
VEGLVAELGSQSRVIDAAAVAKQADRVAVEAAGAEPVAESRHRGTEEGMRDRHLRATDQPQRASE